MHRYISHHTMPLVINALGADTHRHTQRYTNIINKTILRNQATWFKKVTPMCSTIKVTYKVTDWMVAARTDDQVYWSFDGTRLVYPI